MHIFKIQTIGNVVNSRYITIVAKALLLYHLIYFLLCCKPHAFNIRLC